MNFEKMNKIIFPEYTGIKVNMMPILMGIDDSIPKDLHKYLPLINNCKFDKESTVYLSIHESIVEQGKTQRRVGIHTDGTSANSWGGGGWGGSSKNKGIYIASTDGRCKVWDCSTTNVDGHGGVLHSLDDIISSDMEENVLYWMTDRTPHESLPSLTTSVRQWFRLVSSDIGVWFSEHSTHNPMGVKPTSPISHINKFVQA